MSTTRTEVTPAVYLFLRYRDAAAAIEWLVEAFGFRKGIIALGYDGGIAPDGEGDA